MNCGFICCWCLPTINSPVPLLRALCYPSGREKGSGKGHNDCKSPLKHILLRSTCGEVQEGSALRWKARRHEGSLAPWGGVWHHEGARRHEGGSGTVAPAVPGCGRAPRPEHRAHSPPSLPQPRSRDPAHRPPCPTWRCRRRPARWCCRGAAPQPSPCLRARWCRSSPAWETLCPTSWRAGAPQPPHVPQAAGRVPGTATAAATIPAWHRAGAAPNVPGQSRSLPSALVTSKKTEAFFLFPEKNWSVISWCRYLMYL